MAGPTPGAPQPRLRPDLVIQPDAETGRGRVVKDPRSRRYYHFDELEAFILEHLDGQNTPIDIQVGLATLGQEFSLEEIQEFIDILQEKQLVEQSRPLLPVKAPKLGTQVITVLEQGGFRFRRAGEPLPPALAAIPRNMEEARAFDEAVDLLRAGKFQAALRMFEEILDANPENKRVEAVRGLLLEAGAVNARTVAQRQGKKKDSAFYRRFPLFNPDRLFTALEPSLRFIWTSGFLALYLGLVALAGWIAFSHRAVLVSKFPSLTLAEWAGGLFVVAVLLTAMHELAHGLTCKHYGGAVPESGFLLIFFMMPAMYVDVSDAWLFHRRRDRTLVGLAGPMFDLGTGCLALVLWRVLVPGPLASTCMLVLAFCTGSVLLNLNPLLRLDGYYLLSDISGIPNLRQAARSALFRILGTMRGRKQETALTARAGWFIALYGLLSTLWIALILFLMLKLLTGQAAKLAGLWGPLAVGAFLVILLRKPLRRLARLAAGSLTRMTWRRSLSLASIAAGLLVLGLVPWHLRVSGSASVETRLRIGVRPEVAGVLAEILVREGDPVDEGQLVARLDRSELTAELSMTRSDVARATADLELLLQGPEVEEIRQARETVRAAQVEVSHLRTRYERLTRLRDEGLVAADLYEQVGKELDVAGGMLRQSKQELRLLEKGARPERIAGARAEVARLETKAGDLERKLAACELVAPIKGLVVTPDLAARMGEWITAGDSLLEIADTTELKTQVDVLEGEIGDVQPGQEMTLRLAAYPDRTFPGRIEEIAPVAEVDDLGRAFFRVSCSVEDHEGWLKPGMTGSAKIECGSYPLGKLAVRRVLRMIDPSLL